MKHILAIAFALGISAFGGSSDMAGIESGAPSNGIFTADTGAFSAGGTFTAAEFGGIG